MNISDLRNEFGRRVIDDRSIMKFQEDVTKFDVFHEIFRYNRCKRIVEIGTCNGVSSVYLSKYCDELITIDIEYSKYAKEIWDYCGISNINYFVVSSDRAKELLLKNMNFDFAFIDGDHDSPGTQFDFNLVKKCGLILFDDYIKEGGVGLLGVKEVVESLPKEELNFYGSKVLWRANDN